MKTVLLALVLTGLTAGAAAAQPVTGFYVQGGAGVALPQQQSLSLSSPRPASPATSASAAANAAINGDMGAAESGSAGWGFGDGLRVELQGMHMKEAGGGDP